MTKTTEEDRLDEYEKLLEEFLTSDAVAEAIQVGGALPEGLPASARPFPPRILEEGMKLKVPQDLSEFYTMESSLFSSLLPRFYAQVKFIFASMLPPATVKNIIDATGNVGGDVILFRDLYENANIDTIELDKDTFLCLKHNSKDTTLSKVLGRELHNGRVTAHHDNCITYLRRPDIKADVVYFDPPWGGPDYHKEKNLVLTLDEPPEKRKDPVAYTIYPDDKGEYSESGRVYGPITTRKLESVTGIVDSSSAPDYLYEKAKELNVYLNDFKLLKALFDGATGKYTLLDSVLNPGKLRETVLKYPPFLIWREVKTSIIDEFTSVGSEYRKYQYTINTAVGTISFYRSAKYCDSKGRTCPNIEEIIQRIIKIVGFFVEYTGNRARVPVIAIYYMDKNKMLPESTGVKSLGKDVLNSAFKNGDDIVIYRSEELFKLLVHELIHFYDIDKAIKAFSPLSDSLLEIYNINIDQDSKILKVYEAYTEAVACVLNVIFTTDSPDDLIEAFYKELRFSTSQIAKIFDYFGMSAREIYKKDESGKPAFTQQTAAFEYFYLKTKFLLNLKKLLDLIVSYSSSPVQKHIDQQMFRFVNSPKCFKNI